jgi:hypothetical protein
VILKTGMRDRDVRQALHQKILRAHRDDPATLVLDELAVARGEARVDVAVVNGFLHGFELKSASDTLERLPGQVRCFSRVFDRVTLVLAEAHVDGAHTLTPEWWGVKEARMGDRGAVHFRDLRRPHLNPGVDPRAVAQLLWQSEAAVALALRDGSTNWISRSRGELQEALVDKLAISELRDLVRECLRQRQGWREPRQRVRGGGSCRRVAKWSRSPSCPR